MNWDQIEGKWKQLKGSIQERWGKLTNDDLDVIAGQREKFIGRIEERYGFTKEQAQKELDAWAKALDAQKYEREKRAA
jgi:uncharacterized protein YjbJ (UPF0337 family)